MTDFERLILEELRELRENVSDLREAVARLESETTGRVTHRRATMHPVVRDGGLTISAATLGGGLLWLLQHLAGK